MLNWIDQECNIKQISKSKNISEQENGNIPFINVLEIFKEFDLALLATYGQFGEEGVLQPYLEETNIPFTGPDSYSNSLVQIGIVQAYQ